MCLKVDTKLTTPVSKDSVYILLHMAAIVAQPQVSGMYKAHGQVAT